MWIKSEIWMPIKGHENSYEISNNSVVRSLTRKVISKNGSFRLSKGQIIKGNTGKLGYVIISISNKGKTNYKKLHRLVAEAFIPNPLNKPYINHKNGIKHDNRIENLEWCTPQENTVHAQKNNLIKNKARYWKGKFGKLHHNSKTINQIEIKTNKVIRTFYSLGEIERELGLLHGNVGKACRDNRYTCGGYKWQYI